MEGPRGTPGYVIEDAIDLRAYLKLMLRRWWWIVACTLVAAAGAFVVSSLRAPTYEASSLVVITEPRYQMQFAARFEPVDRWELAYEALPDLATSDGVLEGVVAAYRPSPAAEMENWRLGVLKDMILATSGEDASLVKLKVESRSPEDAAGIANVWADTLVARGNRIYRESDADLSFFEDQADQADQALEETEQALIAFRARDRASIVSNQLDAYRQIQTDYLTQTRTIAYLIQDIEGLRDQLSQQPDAEAASLGDEVTALALQVRAFNAQAPTPIQLQVNSDAALLQKSRAEHVAYLEDLVETLEAKSAVIDERLAALEPQILEHQSELQKIQTEGQRLERARTLAVETYVTLSRKVEEARIAAQNGNGGFQVGSRASVPVEPSGQGRLTNMALAGIVGGMIGLGAVFTWHWWVDGREAKEPGS